jgi:hypothetical protein
MDPIKSSVAPETSPRSEIRRAEALLHDIAVELLRVPMQGCLGELHVRALRLKRQIATWTATDSDETVQTILEQTVALHREACNARLAPVRRTVCSVLSR